jgi:hypothetical protein
MFHEDALRRNVFRNLKSIRKKITSFQELETGAV